MIKRIILGCFTALALCGQASFAKDVPGPLFQTTVNDLTLSINTTIPNRCYNFAGIKPTSPLVTLFNANGSECVPNENGYCLFQVCNNSPASITYSGPAGSTDFNLCLNGKGDTASCQKAHFTTQYAYVADDGISAPGSVWQCAVNPDGTLGACAALRPSAQTTPGFSIWTGAYKIAFTEVNDSEYAYIADGNGTGRVYSCSLNVNNDTFRNCAFTTVSAGGFANAVAFATVNDTKYAYVADSHGNSTASGIQQCNISSTDGSLNSCTSFNPAGPGSNNHPIGITTEKFQGTHYAYISDITPGFNAVYQCAIDPLTGNLSIPCSSIPSVGFWTNPRQVAFQWVNGVQYAYVVAGNSGSGEAWQCTLTPTGSFNTCTMIHAFNFPTGIAFDKVDGVHYAYVTDDGSVEKVFRCSLNDNDGTFNVCTSLSEPANLIRPNGITFLTREKETSPR